MNLSSKVMRGGKPRLCIAIIALVVGCVRGAEICERGQTWWDRSRNVCVPCTRCDPARLLAVQLPCEIHRDTVCQSLYNVRIWPFNTPKNNSVGDDEYYEYVDYESEVIDSEEGGVGWDLQTSSLTLAACGCVVFFLVVLILSLYHAKQWRILKRALKSDVQDLTAKLRLMESGAPVEPVVATDHHIYCNIHAGKEALLGPTSSKKLGNVYTQEKHPN